MSRYYEPQRGVVMQLDLREAGIGNLNACFIEPHIKFPVSGDGGTGGRGGDVGSHNVSVDYKIAQATFVLAERPAVESYHAVTSRLAQARPPIEEAGKDLLNNLNDAEGEDPENVRALRPRIRDLLNHYDLSKSGASLSPHHLPLTRQNDLYDQLKNTSNDLKGSFQSQIPRILRCRIFGYKSISDSLIKCERSINRYLIDYLADKSEKLETNLARMQDPYGPMQTLTGIIKLVDAIGREHPIDIHMAMSFEQLTFTINGLFRDGSYENRILSRFLRKKQYDLCVDQGWQVTQLGSQWDDWSKTVVPGTTIVMRAIIWQPRGPSEIKSVQYRCPRCKIWNDVPKGSTRSSVDCLNCDARFQITEDENETRAESISTNTEEDDVLQTEAQQVLVRNARINLQKYVIRETDRSQTRLPDVIIAVMGQKGVGKSTFIRKLTGDESIQIGHSVGCETTEITQYRYFEDNGRCVTLIDTPGFDDSRAGEGVTDVEILRKLSNFFLKEMNGRKLSGIIYLHRITGNRMTGTHTRIMQMFGKLCGPDGLRNVAIVTTRWDAIKDEVEGLSRERQLVQNPKFFKPFIDGGARLLRHIGSYGSACRILAQLVDNIPVEIQFQRELAAGMHVEDTEVGSALGEEIGKLVQKHEVEIRKLRGEMHEAIQRNDLKWKTELEEERDSLMQLIKNLKAGEKQLGERFKLDLSRAGLSIDELEHRHLRR